MVPTEAFGCMLAGIQEGKMEIPEEIVQRDKRLTQKLQIRGGMSVDRSRASDARPPGEGWP